MITIRGEIVFGREAMALVAHDCPGVFKTDGYQWTTAINLVYSGYTPKDETPVSFSTDPEARQQLERLNRDAAQQHGRAKVYATFEGQLRARKKYIIGRTAYGPAGNGYGHLGAFPAQLVIKTVRNIGVIPEKPGR